MKQFEKWAEGRGWRDKKGLFPPGMEDAWRACCEWMLSTRGMNHYETAFANCVQTSVIKKELNS